MSEEYKPGTVADLDTKEVIKPTSVWHNPLIEKLIYALVTAGIAYELITIADS